MNDPQHPILESPWLWTITRIEWALENQGVSSYMDVTFVRDNITRTLRFIDPQDVHIVDGHLPAQCGEMLILDIRGQQLDRLTVQVTEGGASGSPLCLYARSVTDVGSR